MVGDDLMARDLVSRLSRLEDLNVPATIKTLWFTCKAMLALGLGHLDEAQRNIEEAYALASTSASQMLPRGQLHSAAAMIAYERGDSAAIQQSADQLRGLAVTTTSAQPAGAAIVLALAALMKGDAAAAHELAQVALVETREAAMEPALQYSLTILAGARIGLGETASARVVIEEGTLRSRRAHFARLEYGFAILDAACSLSAGETATDELRHALAFGRARGFFGSTVFVPKVLLSKVCAAALAQGIEVEYVKRVATAQGITLAQSPEQVVSESPVELEIVTLGGFSVRLNGEPLLMGRKEPRRPLSLLKAIIAFGGSQVPQTVLENALWPESDGDAARAAFEVNLRRLRRLCVNPDLIQRSGGQVGLDLQRCGSDIRKLEELCRLLGQANKGSEDDSGQLLADLFRTYKGDFLPDEESAWALTARERVRALFVRAVCRAAQALEQRAAWEDALDSYGKGLAASNLVEPFFLGAIRCNVKLGRVADAWWTFERCRRAFSAAGEQLSREMNAQGLLLRPS